MFAIAAAPLTARADRAEVAGVGTSARIRPVEPAGNADLARGRIRDEVLADRGLDRLAFSRMSAQERLMANPGIEAEIARRLAQATRAADKGGLVDLRV